MEELLKDIIAALKENPDGNIDLDKIVHAHNKHLPQDAKAYSKKRLSAFYHKTKLNDAERFATWHIDPELDERIKNLLQVKPRRSASGVATITIMAKPWPCGNNCLYCPNDIRMPKSYLSDEPVCQRAERNWFDPYLQVVGRLRALNQMGHVTDKVEFIILGGTWLDYSNTYQRWFVKELFRALNDASIGIAEQEARRIRSFYKTTEISSDREEIIEQTSDIQTHIHEQGWDYNRAFAHYYGENEAWQNLEKIQTATWAEVEQEQLKNVHAKHRVVGLVMETRPETLNVSSITTLRRLGATKIQIGIQSLNPAVLASNTRSTTLEDIQRAFTLLRLFGFKIHAHFMVNLLGATPEEDKQDYLAFVTDPHYLPDEIKLYPCALVKGTELCHHFDSGQWTPYTEEQLLDVLRFDVLHTPEYMRISRMIRDISAHDIMAGNKKANLRQLVEGSLDETHQTIREIRHREISTRSTAVESLTLLETQYHTTCAEEYFLQWVTEDGSIAGFLRLSLPHQDAVNELEAKAQADNCESPIHLHEAMIREIHIYGSAAGIHKTGAGVQHFGLGKQLVARAETIAREQSYKALNVISAVGTRGYYEKLGFVPHRLYQQKPLD